MAQRWGMAQRWRTQRWGMAQCWMTFNSLVQRI
jgi:hypothetical protein